MPDELNDVDTKYHVFADRLSTTYVVIPGLMIVI